MSVHGRWLLFVVRAIRLRLLRGCSLFRSCLINAAVLCLDHGKAKQDCELARERAAGRGPSEKYNIQSKQQQLKMHCAKDIENRLRSSFGASAHSTWCQYMYLVFRVIFAQRTLHIIIYFLYRNGGCGYCTTDTMRT